MVLVLPKEFEKLWFIRLKNSMSYEKLFKSTSLTGEWIYSFTRGILFIRMANFQSPFTKRILTSSCTSLFDHSIKDILSRITFGGSWNATYDIIQRKKTSLNSRFFLRLRNRGFRKYLLKKLFQHVTYAQRNELLNSKISTPAVCESLTLQEAETRIIREGEEIFNLSQEVEVASLADPRTSTLNANLSTTNQRISKDTGKTGLQPGITSTKG